jgi:hypothetical protein
MTRYLTDALALCFLLGVTGMAVIFAAAALGSLP